MAGCAATNVNQGRYASLTSQRDSLFLKISGAMYCGEIDSGQKYVRTARSRRTYAGGTTDLRQEVELLIVHDPAETKVCNHDVCILVLRAEEQVLGLQVPVDDVVRVQVVQRQRDFCRVELGDWVRKAL